MLVIEIVNPPRVMVNCHLCGKTQGPIDTRMKGIYTVCTECYAYFPDIDSIINSVSARKEFYNETMPF